MGNLERALVEVRSLLDTGTMPGELTGRTGLPRESLPAVWVAAMEPRGLKLVGRYADGWLPIGTGPDAYAEEVAARIRPVAQAGARHVLLADVTGTTYEPSEAARHLQELARLKAILGEI